MLAEKGQKVFEDEKTVAFLNPEPANLGHIIVTPKEHFTILEQVPDFLAGHLFNVANKISTTIFETLKVHGTNIIIENGSASGQKVAHFAINIIARSENDGLGFNWPPIQVSEEDMSTTELQLKELTKNIGGFDKEEKKAITVEEKENVLDTTEEDYLMRQLRKIP